MLEARNNPKPDHAPRGHARAFGLLHLHHLLRLHWFEGAAAGDGGSGGWVGPNGVRPQGERRSPLHGGCPYN